MPLIDTDRNTENSTSMDELDLENEQLPQIRRQFVHSIDDRELEPEVSNVTRMRDAICRGYEEYLPFLLNDEKGCQRRVDLELVENATNGRAQNRVANRKADLVLRVHVYNSGDDVFEGSLLYAKEHIAAKFLTHYRAKSEHTGPLKMYVGTKLALERACGKKLADEIVRLIDRICVVPDASQK